MTQPSASKCKISLPPNLSSSDRSRHRQGRDEARPRLIYVEYDANELLRILMDAGTSYGNGYRNWLKTNRDE